MKMLAEELNDIVQSQLCIYGDREVFFVSELKESEQPRSINISVDGNNFFEFVSSNEALTDKHSLQKLGNLLSVTDGSLEIKYSWESLSKPNFKLGMRSESEGFIEMINSKELAKL